MPGKMKYKTPNRETPNGKLCGFCSKQLLYRQKAFCSKECMVKGLKVDYGTCFCGEELKVKGSKYCSKKCSSIAYSKAIDDKFKENIIKRIGKTDNPDECWLWLGFRDNKGYGIYGLHGKRSSQKAHRLVYEIFNGEIPEGHLVRHTCDNPSCVNPKHLLTGTVKDNVLDIIERKRYKNQIMFKPGESNPVATLTMVQVKEIRNIYDPINTEFTQKKLADIYGVSRHVIHQVVNHETYKDETSISFQKKFTKQEIGILRGRKLTMQDAQEIRKLYSLNPPGVYHKPFSTTKLAKQFGVNAETIRKIINNLVYKE